MWAPATTLWALYGLRVFHGTWRQCKTPASTCIIKPSYLEDKLERALLRTSGVSSTEVGRVTASTRLSLSDAVSPSAFASASNSYIAEKQKRKRSQALSRILGVDIQKDPSTFENPSPSTPMSHREQPLLCHKLWMLRTTKTAQTLSGKAACSGYCPPQQGSPKSMVLLPDFTRTPHKEASPTQCESPMGPLTRVTASPGLVCTTALSQPPGLGISRHFDVTHRVATRPQPHKEMLTGTHPAPQPV